jgi:predicted Zn-dependent peptidase
MFGGSENVPSFDAAIENAGGQNNAFTTNEITNYYISVPLENVETAFWLESDRMLALNINEKSLSVQQGVVVEEFKQRCYNAPFGQLWHHIRQLLYTESPYRWPTIGLDISHVEDATLEDVQSFYNQFYTPQNAIVSIVGNLSLEETIELCEKWFGKIEKAGNTNKNEYTVDVPQNERRFLETTDLSPNPAVFLVWKGPSHKEEGSLELDVFADLLGGSDVSDLQQILVKEKQICNAAECFYIRGLDEGLFILYGILNPEVTHETVENELLKTMNEFIQKGAEHQYLFDGIKNKVYTNLLFEQINPMNRAQKLAYYENLGKLDAIQAEAELVKNLDLQSVINYASATFQEKNMSVIYYSPKQ